MALRCTCAWMVLGRACQSVTILDVEGGSAARHLATAGVPIQARPTAADLKSASIPGVACLLGCRMPAGQQQPEERRPGAPRSPPTGGTRCSQRWGHHHNTRPQNGPPLIPRPSPNPAPICRRSSPISVLRICIRGDPWGGFAVLRLCVPVERSESPGNRAVGNRFALHLCCLGVNLSLAKPLPPTGLVRGFMGG